MKTKETSNGVAVCSTGLLDSSGARNQSAAKRPNSMNAIEEISETIAQTLYGKSSKIAAPENQNDDFCWGYSVGTMAAKQDKDELWNAAWRNYGSPLSATPEWADWKRGFHAGRFAAIGAAAPAPEQSNTLITDLQHKQTNTNG